jgi:prepilin-type N-terminal cleavage/methylation domain-containing protein
VEARRTTDAGFTLIELLVVMIIIGVLAAIAIPTFMSQRGKAHDSSTQSDVTNLGKEIATYYVDGTGALTLDYLSQPGKVVLTDGSFNSVVNLTNGTAVPGSGGYSGLGSATGWCVSLTDSHGIVRDYRYTARSGLEPGTC